MKSGWTLAIAAMLLVCASTPRVYAQAPQAEEPATGTPEGEPALGDEEAMVLNFERADIREVIHSLATALGLSYTIDPRIEGQVTIRTTGKIPREDLFPLFNQILRNNGIAAVKVGNVYQVLPVAEAKTRAIIPRAAVASQSLKATDSFVIEIVPLRHVTGDEMVNILQPFLTPGGDALSYSRANLVVMTDLGSNIERLKDLIHTFDADAFENQHARVFKMKHGDPEEIANEMIGLLAPYGITPTGDGEGGLFMVPLTRLNAIVVIAFDVVVFAEVERWLKILDIPPDEESGRQTFVYSVENAKAADLAAVLNELFGGGPGGGGAGGLGRQPGAAPAGVGLFGAGGVSGGRAGGGGLGNRRGGLGGGGVPGAPGAAQAQAAGGGRQLGGAGGRGLGRAGGGVPGVPGVPGATGATVAPGQPGGVRGVSLPGGPAGAGAPGQGAGPPPVFKQEVRIVADDVTNSLVILATKRDYQFILDILKRIDVVPRQVVLEVTIAEIALTKDLEFGIAFAIGEHRLNEALPPAMEGKRDLLTNRGPKGTGRDVGGLIGTASQVPLQGAFAIFTDRGNYNVFINALQKRTNVKMLSAPHIMAADNREAHILVGQSIPILTSTQQSTAVNSNVLNSVQYRDTGKILTILPQVNSKGLVNMQVRQEVSAVLAGGASFGQTGSPAFSTRETETTLVVQDGDTVIIGGIIDDAVGHIRTGVPYLMDVPFLGRFFRQDTDTIDRTELLVTITPYVVRGREDAVTVTDDFTARIEGFKSMRESMRAHRTQRPSEAATSPDAGGTTR